MDLKVTNNPLSHKILEEEPVQLFWTKSGILVSPQQQVCYSRLCLPVSYPGGVLAFLSLDYTTILKDKAQKVSHLTFFL